MATNVLQLVSDFTDKQGLPTPTALIGVTEKSVVQYRAILLDVVADLSERSWQQQILRKTWLSAAGQNQGTLESIFGAGYISLIPDTMWNDDRVMQIRGPVPPSVWQRLQNLPYGGPEYLYWISGNVLYVSPDLENVENLSAMYRTKYGVLSAGGTAKERVTVDTDTLLFPDQVVRKGFEAKWRKIKGEPGWEDDYNEYMGLIARNIVKDGAPTLSLDSPVLYPKPGILIPSGNWNV